MDNNLLAQLYKRYADDKYPNLRYSQIDDDVDFETIEARLNNEKLVKNT